MRWQGVFDSSVAHDRCVEFCEMVLQYVPINHRDRIAMAYREIIINAISASPNQDSQILIEFDLHNGFLSLEVYNDGTPFTPRLDQWFMPDEYAEHGRGLPIIKKCTDSRKFISLPNGTGIFVTWTLDSVRGWSE